MTGHAAFNGQRQRVVIRKLQRNAGMEATDLAQAVGLSYPQLLRYAYGKVPIRTFQLPVFAKAFGIDPLDFAAELGGENIYEDQASDPTVQGWSFRTALRGHIPEDLIAELAETWEGRPLINQMSAVEGILRMAERQRRDATSPHAKTTPSAHAV